MDVQTADCVCAHEHRRRLGDLTSYQYLLDVSSGQFPYRIIDAGSLDVQVHQNLFRQFFRTLGIYENALSFVPGSEHHVSCHSHAAYKAHAQSVLRHESQGNAGVLDLHGCLSHKLSRAFSLRGIDDGSLGYMTKSRNGFQKLLLPGTCNTCDSQDLSAVGDEAHVIQLDHSFAVPYGKACNRQSGLGIHGIGSLDIE